MDRVSGSAWAGVELEASACPRPRLPGGAARSAMRLTALGRARCGARDCGAVPPGSADSGRGDGWRAPSAFTAVLGDDHGPGP